MSCYPKGPPNSPLQYPVIIPPNAWDAPPCAAHPAPPAPCAAQPQDCVGQANESGKAVVEHTMTSCPECSEREKRIASETKRMNDLRSIILDLKLWRLSHDELGSIDEVRLALSQLTNLYGELAA